MKELPKQIDFVVEVEQGTARKTMYIMAPTKEKAISQAERILKYQRVKPWRIISITERKL